MKFFMASMRAVFMKDVRTELRTREFLGNTLMFALLVIVIFNFAFRITPKNLPEMASGILWIAFLFAGTLGLGRCFAVEKENDCINGLLLTPIDRTALFWAKVLSNLAFLLMIQVIILPVFIVLYNINVMEHFAKMSIVFLLGDIGFMTLGTLISAMSVNLKARELLLPVLLLPLLIPLLIFCVKAGSVLIESGDMALYYSRMKLIAAFDVIFFVASSLLFEYIVDEL